MHPRSAWKGSSRKSTLHRPIAAGVPSSARGLSSVLLPTRPGSRSLRSRRHRGSARRPSASRRPR
jgi:hypothetical protein